MLASVFFNAITKIPENTAARKARQLASVQKQLDLFKSDCNKLQDEVVLLRISNSNLRDQLSSIQDNAKLVVDLQEQLASATAQSATDQIASSIASFNCHRAEAALQTLRTNLDDKTDAENYWREQFANVSKERDTLLGTLNDIRSRFAWDLPSFQPAADNFVSASKRLINDLSRRFIPHGLAPDSRLARLEVELDELRAANIEYARELRELRRRY